MASERARSGKPEVIIMTLEKAMELIQQDLDDPGSVDIMDLHEAQRLGIEAMRFIKRHSIFLHLSGITPLPGETKE